MDRPIAPARGTEPVPQGHLGRRWHLTQRATAVIYGVVAALLLIALIAAGSRGFHWFDAALIGYTIGTIFAVAAVTYKYTFWLMRPQTGRYFRRGWSLFLSGENFRRYATLVPVAIVRDLLLQRFIAHRNEASGGGRGLYRWITHQCIFWGVVLSCLITFPLTFSWLRFTPLPNGWYHMWVWGFPLIEFDPYSPFGFFVYHALIWTALLLLLGLILAFHRRFHDLALISIQRFRFDIVPLALLLAIVVTGLALAADYTFFGAAYYYFIALTHEAVVVFWLISLPFGKFFHILERPATVGIELYWRTGEDSTPHACPRCGVAFAPARFVDDLKRTTFDIGQNWAIDTANPHTGPAAPRDQATNGVWWQDFCPDCKRIMRAEANLTALGREGNQFL